MKKKEQINLHLDIELKNKFLEACENTYINHQELLRGFVELICSFKYFNHRLVFIGNIKRKQIIDIDELISYEQTAIENDPNCSQELKEYIKKLNSIKKDYYNDMVNWKNNPFYP